MLLAPIWNRDKNAVIAAVQSALEEKNLRQGMYYKT
jgi:radical SAM superfamily enzyme